MASAARRRRAPLPVLAESDQIPRVDLDRKVLANYTSASPRLATQRTVAATPPVPARSPASASSCWLPASIAVLVVQSPGLKLTQPHRHNKHFPLLTLLFLLSTTILSLSFLRSTSTNSVGQILPYKTTKKQIWNRKRKLQSLCYYNSNNKKYFFSFYNFNIILKKVYLKHP